MVEANAFQAIGKSWPGFWLFILRVGTTLSLAYFLTYHLDMSIMAVWGAVITGNILASVVGYFWITKTLEEAQIENVAAH
jgi:Na+-driven multidrug efflux pump